MTKSVVRLTLIVTLLLVIVTPTLTKSGSAVLQPMMADTSPIPWHHLTIANPPVAAAGLPTLMADTSPIPWHHLTIATPPVAAAGLPMLMADTSPIPWHHLTITV